MRRDPYFEALQDLVQRDRFETPKLDKTINLTEKVCTVVLLHITNSPELVGDDLRQDCLAKCRDVRDRLGKPYQVSVAFELGLNHCCSCREGWVSRLPATLGSLPRELISQGCGLSATTVTA